MRHISKIAVIAALAFSASAMADTQTVNTNVTFINDLQTTVNNPIEFGTLIKATGDCDMSAAAALSNTACSSGAVFGTPAVGNVTVTGQASTNMTVSVDTTNASDTGVTFTPVLANNSAPSTPLTPLSGVIENLGAGGSQTYILYGSLAVDATTVVDNPTLSVDFTVVY